MEISDKLSLLAIVISVLSFGFTWYSFYKTDRMSNITFNKNYRPYVAASNFAFIDQRDGKYYPDIRVLIIKPFNAPAFITSKKLSFYITENGAEKVYFEHPEYKNEILYPFDNAQYVINTGDEILNPSIADKLSAKNLTRKVRIEYQWISDSTLKYYFEASWKYSFIEKNWTLISQSAD